MKKEIIKGITTGLKHATDAGLDTLAEIRPEFKPHVAVVKAFFRILEDLKQDRINEFVESIRDNPECFAKKIVETKAFQDGFVITFEAYMKERIESKRKIIQRIFIGFTASSDKENFEMERMYNAVSLISIEGILSLRYLKDQILPMIYEKSQKLSLSKKQDKNDYILALGIIEFIGKEIKSLKDDTLEKKINRNETLGELVSLGILKSNLMGDMGGITFTKFGINFIEFIEDTL